MKRNKLIYGVVLLALLIASCKKEEMEQTGYYTCPMHPQVVSSEPGNCPICGMDLVYKELEHKHEEGMDMSGSEDHSKHKDKVENFRFSLSKNMLINARLATVAVEERAFIKKVNYAAHIDFNENPDKLVIINTKYDGWVEKLYVSKEGQWIQKGDVLIGVYSPQILAAKEEYLTAYTSLKALYELKGNTENLVSDPTLMAARRKLRYLDVSEGQIRNIEKTGSVGRLVYYHAPIGGVIVKKNVLQGEYIKPGQEIFRIANLSSLWVFIHIFEKDLPFVKKGQRVNLKTEAYPNKEFSGRIDLIYPYLDKESKDIKVRIEISNPGYTLKPGMFAEAEIVTRFPGKSLIIPESAVFYSGEESYVFVSLGQGRFELRKVEIILTSNKESLVASGLKKDDLVVTNGQFLLDSEASLKEALSKGQPAGHSH